MKREKLGIEHKDLLVPRLKALRVPVSEYTFPNLFLFRKNHDYEVITDGEIFIKGRTYDGRSYLMPTAALPGIDRSFLKEIMKEADLLFPIPESWLPNLDPEEFTVTFYEGDSDYVYTVEKMSTFKGRHLHKKRNLLKQFTQAYRHEAKPLTPDALDEARFILDDWLATSGMKPEDTDYQPCKEALDRYEELVLCGGIYYADDEPAGFVLGEELNPETYVLHFAKARPKFKGVYQYLFNNFAQVLPPKYKYLNLEQDLEKENLRIFKSSYLPDHLVRKARVSLQAR